MRIKCIACKKPIRLDDWGGVVKKGFFHNWLFCLIKLVNKKIL